MTESLVVTMVTLVSDRQRMVLIKVANFLTRVCTLTGSPRIKIPYFVLGKVGFQGTTWKNLH